jgi:hypothetical protein
MLDVKLAAVGELGGHQERPDLGEDGVADEQQPQRIPGRRDGQRAMQVGEQIAGRLRLDRPRHQVADRLRLDGQALAEELRAFGQVKAGRQVAEPFIEVDRPMRVPVPQPADEQPGQRIQVALAGEVLVPQPGLTGRSGRTLLAATRL